MYDSNKAHALLTEATDKLIELRQKPGWDTELPPRFPPLLYSGNARTEKPRVLTVAANPSRREFVEKPSDDTLEEIKRTGDFSKLRFLDTPRSRPLTEEESLEDLRDDEELQTATLRSNDDYFNTNPYTKWFGKNTTPSFRVEQFLRGFGASYYESSDEEHRAIQIDLFPFATLADFNTLEDLAQRDLFDDGWAQEFLGRLLTLLQPEVLIVFGRSNARHFGEYFDRSIQNSDWISLEGEKPGWYKFSQADQFEVPVVSLSTNLGDPKPFSAEELKMNGDHIRDEFEQWE